MANFKTYLCNTWAVIAVSVKPVFGWTNAEISLMMNWYCFMFLLFIFPLSWLTEAKGLRLPVLITIGCLFLATILRCISMRPPMVMWLNQVSCCLIGIAQPVVYTACPVLSSLWFPAKERVTITSATMAIGFFGYGMCFILGAQFVSTPKEVFHPHRSNSSSHVEFSNLDEIRQEILISRIVECVVCGVIFVLILLYFPNKPPKPPTPSAAVQKEKFFHGVKSLVRSANKDFWLVTLVFAISTAVYSTWVSLIAENFANFASQSEIGYLGCLANIVGSVAAVIAGRFADAFVGKMKLIIILFLCLSVFSTFWVLLLAMQFISLSKAQFYISIILQGIGVAGPNGLFVEMNIEANYPLHEVIISGTMGIMYNICPLIFLCIFFIPKIGVSWMNWFLYGSLLLCVPLMLAAKEHYNRLAVDNTDSQTVSPGNSLTNVKNKNNI